MHAETGRLVAEFQTEFSARGGYPPVEEVQLTSPSLLPFSFALQVTSGMHVATTAVQHDGWIVGRRYLHGKTSRPLTLRYIGPLPPISSDASTSNPGNSVIWLGVEYDDPSHGKGHSGTYEGTQVFNTRQQGAGAFVKLSPGALKRGPTLVEAIEERYGDILPRADHIDSDETTKDAGSSRLYLGTSSREVETPGLAQVQIKVGKLERLREIGLDGRWVDSLGGSKETQKALRNRVHREL